jgi:hypothetical protein
MDADQCCFLDGMVSGILPVFGLASPFFGWFLGRFSQPVFAVGMVISPRGVIFG